MSKTFIATTGSGIARATPNGKGWAVEHHLSAYDVRCLAADPHNPQVVYAGTQNHGVLRSQDGGRTWRVAGLADQVIKALAVSPLEPDVIYAGTKPPGLFVSRDGGASWTERESLREMRQFWWFTPAEPGPEYVQAIALSPTDPDVILAGIEFGAVLRSADGGETWASHRPGALRDCHTMGFHPADGDWVYEAGGGGAAFSRDGGKTWQQPRQGLDRRYGWAWAADPARPEVWYASLSPMGSFPRMVPLAHVDGEANAFIFRRIGDGPWQKLGGGLPQPLDFMPYALLTDPAEPGHLYAGLSNGEVWVTADYGDTWSQLPLNLGAIRRSLIALNGNNHTDK